MPLAHQWQRVPGARGGGGLRFVRVTPLADNLWFLPYPLRLLGADLRRNVTVMRLASGDLVIHSTGPFTPEDVAAINALGRPRWLLDTMLRHETFAKNGREAFPEAVYLAPEGFSEAAGFPTQPLISQPEWSGEIEVLRLDGVPSMEEHVVLHRPTRTLIVADLIFNFGAEASAWTHLLMCAAVGTKHDPGMARSIRWTAKDRAALRASLARMMAWDFDRLIVGHGDLIATGAKAQVAAALARAGY